MELEQSTPMDSIKDVVRSSVKVPEFDKHPKKAGGNVVEITIKMKTIVRKPLMVKTLDCGIVVSEFELQSRYYVHFRTNTLVKDMSLHVYTLVYTYIFKSIW